MKLVKLSGVYLARFASSFALLTFLVPYMVFAQSPDAGTARCDLPTIENAGDVVAFVMKSVECTTPFLISLALLYIIIGVIQFIRSSEEGGSKVEDLKRKLLMGIIGLFVILSIWGIIAVVSRTLGTGTGGFFEAESASSIEMTKFMV